MEYGLTVLVPPTVEPVTLAVAKAHLRIDHTAEDTLITAYIAAARRLTEEYTHQRWLEQQLRLTLRAFPENGCPIRLPVQPVMSIDAVSYLDEAGVSQLLVPADYQTWLDHTPPLVLTVDDEDWPDTDEDALQAVTVDFTAGGELADVPEQVKAAMLLCLGNWDENRGDQNVLIAKGLPPAARFLLDQLWTGAYS